MAEQTEEEKRDRYLRVLGYPGWNKPHPHDRAREASTTDVPPDHPKM